MEQKFTATSLLSAVRWLFETNGYDVSDPVERRGVEVELVATQLSGFSEQNVYIEPTVQQVDGVRYDEYLAKLTPFRNEPGAQRMIISPAGFAPGVKERAGAEGILTFTYDELFANFERVQPYLSYILGDSIEAKNLQALDEVYEEPNFDDKHGKQWATAHLNDWLRDDDKDRSWLIIVGEYGTGKTALTEVLQKRWTELYQKGVSPRLPFRIELRDFTKQFDSRGLLHHFLDRNELAHLPVAFVESMIANGHVVLLLDGYDEMAQYLNVRERRACLEALADLASNGARGILTSRPNYFTEAEELRVFEVLYKKLGSPHAKTSLNHKIAEKEREVDLLLERFVLNRVERSLRDLTEEQTIELVRRRLKDDPEGAEVVTGLLSKVFRNDEDRNVSLSGKPVIITYLLDVVEELKEDSEEDTEKKMSEWDIYNLIVNKLMLRDWGRTNTLDPDERLLFLQQLALYTSISQQKSLNESSFREVTRKVFESKIARKRIEGATDAEDSLFDDLRTSTTLTASTEKGIAKWQFSHNSLREFLLAGYLIDCLVDGKPEPQSVPVTDTMITFVNSMPEEKLREAYTQLSALWPSRKMHKGIDQMLTLLWGAKRHNERKNRGVAASLRDLIGDSFDLSNCTLTGVNFSSGDQVDLRGLNASSSIMTDTVFTDVDLTGSNFSESAIDACVLTNADVSGADFSNLLMLDTEITGLVCTGANFTNLTKDSTALLKVGKDLHVLDATRLRGYLKRRGAITDPVNPYFMFCLDQNFDICEKICRVLLDGAWHQRLGLEQRGASERNVRLAKKFVQFLISVGHVQIKNGTGGKLIGTTQSGRPVVARLSENAQIDETLLPFFEQNLNQ
ncbi:NACHT domain-containing protein [Amycolatopsis sp. SID8362]|uniref:NACHT domain-containing protein n=1 Tax=Amycolatopsis sp. SID8362 TaxID=2690346 RepID=UPI00136E95ED|nr:NACHT domain-containing protein [Amycolatopsis sp. SID8362]NBH12174.1 NACHT domain-containing protein [Amycolatopsis sp. SID8362]NED48866.1 NACHT domain-containing protein [Amycolatopsis sp. SID8362]